MGAAETGADRFARCPEVFRYEVAGSRLVVVRFCWTGKGHVEQKTQCQDWADVYPHVSENATPEGIVAVVADGVSTQPLSGEGARIACTAFSRLSDQGFAPDASPSARFAESQIEFADMCRSHRLAHTSPGENSEPTEPQITPSSSESIVEYATTALVLCIQGATCWAASVGDGAIYRIADEGRQASLMTQIHREGYANEVRPLTSAKWQLGYVESAPAFAPREGVQGFCLMTDGLSESVGDPNAYFAAVWPQLKERLGDPIELAEYAEAFCRYWEDRRFSDDDKTLLAVFVDP